MKIAIGIPSRGTILNKIGKPTSAIVEGVQSEFVLPIWLEHFSKVVEEAKKDFEIIVIHEPCLYRNIKEQRNTVFEKCLETNPDYLLALDDDTFLPLNGIKKLFAADKDIISGIYWLKEKDSKPCAGKWCIEEERTIFPIEKNKSNAGYHCGFGCCLIKAELLKRLSKPIVPLFMEPYKGVIWGEDIAFFKKALDETGEKIWIHKGVLCDHYDYHIDKWYPDEETCLKYSGRRKFCVAL